MNYRLNDTKMYADISDGIAIIINFETGVYFGLNGFGSSVYQNLTAGASAEAVAEALKALQGAPADSADKLCAFIKDLKDKEILVEAPASEAPVTIDAAAAEADGFEPGVQEFSDAQELLLADPIHEVKEEEGWSPFASSLNEDKEDVSRREAKMND